MTPVPDLGETKCTRDVAIRFPQPDHRKIKIRTSSAHPGITIRALYANEVRTLIYDDPAEENESQHPIFFSPKYGTGVISS